VSASRDYVWMRVLQPALRVTATNAKLADALASRALDSADLYVDRFLPGDAATENGDGKLLLCSIKQLELLVIRVLLIGMRT